MKVLISVQYVCGCGFSTAKEGEAVLHVQDGFVGLDKSNVASGHSMMVQGFVKPDVSAEAKADFKYMHRSY